MEKGVERKVLEQENLKLCYLVEGNAYPQNQTFVKPCESEGWREKGGGDPYGTRSRQTAFLNFRVDASKRLNESVLIRKTEKV